MKLTVMVDNNTLIDQYFVGEPGVAFLIEEGNRKILFDTGYSDIVIKNALKMGEDLRKLDYVVLSHGHNDHTWGLIYLSEYLQGVKTHHQPKTKLVAHPEIFAEKVFEGEMIGSYLSEDKVEEEFDLRLSEKPVWLTDRLVYLGKIPRMNSIENQHPIGKTLIDGQMMDDYVEDDSALAYRSDEGLVIITGCSHCGITNIIAHAQLVCEENRILDIIGGFHLQKASEETLKYTGVYMDSQRVKQIHPCHCTDLAAKIALSKYVEVQEVGVGLELTYK